MKHGKKLEETGKKPEASELVSRDISASAIEQ
jgi:hypothetical protein